MKKVFYFGISLILSVYMVMAGIPAMTVYASDVEFTNVGGWSESIYAQISGVSDGEVTAVSYTGAMSGELAGDDFTYLIRDYGSGVRIDIPGLTPGTYSLHVETTKGNLDRDGLVVTAYDRSGYAHFNYTDGVGAYNDNGTLKDNTVVIYVTNDNKNTVSVTSKDGTTVTGIGNILNSAGKATNGNNEIIKKLAKDGTPLVVRIVGTVSDSTVTDITTNEIIGLTVYNSTDWGGSKGDNGHMARMQSGKNITIEGIGSDAVVDGWGFHFICESGEPELGKSFEVRNISFKNTPEDAIGMEGQQSGSQITAGVERCWIHNNSFFVPHIVNPAEDDKGEGDGSVDFKRGQYFTCSYNYFEGCHKTNLVGANDASLQYNLTYHHNYWRWCKARGPLTRNANVHMYNNVFEGQTDYAMNVRANAYIFSEYNLFYMSKGPQAVKLGAIKSYNDSFSSCILSNQGSYGTVVNDRKEYVANNCQYAYSGISYDKFDTDSSLSYIPQGNYYLQTDITEARKVVSAHSGVMKEYPKDTDAVTMTDISLLSTVAGTPDEITGTLPVTRNVGKVEKKAYAFTVYTTVDVTVSYSTDDAAKTGVLVNEAGAVLLTGSGTAYSLPAGTYMIQPMEINPGDATGLGVFKSVTVNSLEISAADSGYDPDKLQSISLDKTTMALKTGETGKLTVRYSPSSATDDKTVTWSSSYADVASVASDGTVTALRAGTTTITAQVGLFTAKCVVNVSEAASGGDSGNTGGSGGNTGSGTQTEAFVDRLYSLVFGRPADEGGKTSWVNALTSGKSSGVDIGYGFLFSDECKNRNLSNEEFVEILYKTFMDRASDEGGKKAWVSQLDAGIDREKVFEGFVMSQEFSNVCENYGIRRGEPGDVGGFVNALGRYRNKNADITKFVARCYTQALGRNYETDGLEAWCKVVIEKNNTPKQVAQNFIFSDEFVQKNLGNEEYVKVLYRTFMGREADEGGLNAWVNVLASGREDRAKVLEGFSDSAEFAEILKSFGLN